MQGKKIETWFVSPSSRKCFGVESAAFLSANKFIKNLSTGKVMFFSISEAIKIAVSFSIFQCLYAMLLLRDNSKHGFTVA